MQQAALLYDLRDQLVYEISGKLGIHKNGLAQLAREARNRGVIDKAVANKLTKIDFSYNLVRHLDPPSVQKFMLDLKAMLAETPDNSFAPDAPYPEVQPQTFSISDSSSGSDSEPNASSDRWLNDAASHVVMQATAAHVSTQTIAANTCVTLDAEAQTDNDIAEKLQKSKDRAMAALSQLLARPIHPTGVSIVGGVAPQLPRPWADLEDSTASSQADDTTRVDDLSSSWACGYFIDPPDDLPLPPPAPSGQLDACSIRRKLAALIRQNPPTPQFPQAGTAFGAARCLPLGTAKCELCCRQDTAGIIHIYTPQALL